MSFSKKIILISLVFSAFYSSKSLAQRTFTHADTLQGSITPQRAWWDAVYYDLHVAVHPSDSTIDGYNSMTYSVTGPQHKMQIDLQKPMKLDSILQQGQKLSFKRDGDAFFVKMPPHLKRHSLHKIRMYFHGKPRIAKNPPWDGGFVWTQDSLGHRWVSTAVQGLGPSAWWPNKDHPSDEPDSATINITVPKPMADVSNGRLRKKIDNDDGTTTYQWHVSNPINKYGISINAGNYVNFSDTLHGEKGILDLNYWVLKQHKELAKQQFKQVKPMLRCFEHWFGPYPFYEDGYKLVEAPYLGMEHQSAVTYGNGFQNGYHGEDLSGTGWGLKWDFIIIHESGHEWWANSITANDVADNWIHEGFTSYAEALYTECQYGKKAGEAYTRGTRKRDKNKRPIVAHHGVHQAPPEDMYWKGANLLLTIRTIMNDEEAFRDILRGLQKRFYHQTVSSKQVERYINAHTDYDFTPVFEQFLHHAEIPILQYYIKNNVLYYRWQSAVPHFDMPMKVKTADQGYRFVHPTPGWKHSSFELTSGSIRFDPNIYARVDSSFEVN